jgi:hypothetical protein
MRRHHSANHRDNQLLTVSPEYVQRIEFVSLHEKAVGDYIHEQDGSEFLISRVNGASRLEEIANTAQ